MHSNLGEQMIVKNKAKDAEEAKAKAEEDARKKAEEEAEADAKAKATAEAPEPLDTSPPGGKGACPCCTIL